ncbi:MAG: type II toxin-antitoxin system VapC family toxin [Gemmatimonadetes bacterium]|nr:type II toxin-antitoxin system VapC family toxin [Gemmatimonadota bacterium]
MIFLDTNVFIHHVGRRHPLRDRAREVVSEALERDARLVTSAEVMQELVHFYRRSRRESVLRDALALLGGIVDEVWPVERADVELAWQLADRHPALDTRDLVHLACCLRREPREVVTFDRGLAAAWEARG